MNVPRAWKRVPRRACWRVAAAGAALLVFAAVALPPAHPPALLTTARFPHVSPHKLAHMLADFSTHLLLYPHLGEWTVEEESGNYTTWRYAVSYSCGARCSGRARVLALDRHDAAPAHAAPRDHLVRVAHTSCNQLPIISWLQICDEWETETVLVEDDAGGAVLREEARASCGPLRRVVPAAAPLSCRARLRAQRDQHLQRLRALVAVSDS